MPTRIPLQTEPNQAFSAQLDNQRYEVTLKSARGIVSASVTINGVVVVLNSRFFGGTLLIPYEYLEGDGGNFIFLTDSGDLPAYQDFDTTQFLFYVSAAEMADAR